MAQYLRTKTVGCVDFYKAPTRTRTRTQMLMRGDACDSRRTPWGSLLLVAGLDKVSQIIALLCALLGKTGEQKLDDLAWKAELRRRASMPRGMVGMVFERPDGRVTMPSTARPMLIVCRQIVASAWATELEKWGLSRVANVRGRSAYDAAGKFVCSTRADSVDGSLLGSSRSGSLVIHL